jgi:anti-sigma regulatory factor (Ser/Thr protein kinase)
MARRFVGRYLRRRRLPKRAVDAALLVSSELVTNAYRHGQGEIELRVGVSKDRVRIEVIDHGCGEAPAVREQPGDEAGGWGLRIVDQLALQWGVFEGTTHVWADVAVS